MRRVAVIGAAGYAGIEAVRWVLAHPRLELGVVTSTADAGRRVSDVYPSLEGQCDALFAVPDVEAIVTDAEIAILSVPHTAALEVAPELLGRGMTVIDLSADFRLSDPAVYEQWYGVEHTAPELLESAAYGLPELDRTALAGAKLVACPGCYPTATILAALPVMASGMWRGGAVRVDAKSGVSGAGRSPSAATHFVSANESVSPYKVGTHRHTPEMEQALSSVAKTEVPVIFVPHLIPMSRGLLSTVYLDVDSSLGSREAAELYREHYADEPFVRVCEGTDMPSTAAVSGTNNAVVAVYVDERTSTLVATCAIDNLGKGSASQGIQCLNAVLGYPEAEGLCGFGPVV